MKPLRSGWVPAVGLIPVALLVVFGVLIEAVTREGSRVAPTYASTCRAAQGFNDALLAPEGAGNPRVAPWYPGVIAAAQRFVVLGESSSDPIIRRTALVVASAELRNGSITAALTDTLARQCSALGYPFHNFGPFF